MEKNNDKVKLNDELLDKVSGGGYWGGSALLRCSNCGFTGDDPDLSAGQECPRCQDGILY